MSLIRPAGSISAKTRRKIERLRNSPQLGLRVHLVTKELFELDQESTTEVELINFSSHGALIRIPDYCPLPANWDEIKIYLGKKLLADINSVEPIWWNTDSGLMGLEFRKRRRPVGIRQRARIGLTSQSRLRPSFMSLDPLVPGEKLFFRILDISSKGFLLETSLRNKHLLEGMPLEECQILFPDFPPLHFEVTVRHVQSLGDSLQVGVEFQSTDIRFLENLVRLALLVGHFPVDSEIKTIFDEISSAGFKIKKIARACKVDLVETSEDYQRVLELRWKAYKAVGKIEEGKTAFDMGDEFDPRSLIIILRVNNHILATVRMVRCLSSADIFPFQKSLPEIELKLGRKRKACELSRLAVDPDIKGTDLAAALMTRICDFSLRAGFAELFCLSTAKLRPVYERFGFKDTGHFAGHPVLKNERMTLLSGDPVRISSSKDVPALLWEALFKDVVLTHRELGIFERLPNPILHKMRLGFEKTIVSLNKKIKS